MTLLGEPELTLIGAVQETSADPAGHAVALLFNRDINSRTGMVLENYSLAGKNVFGAFLQASKRIVVIGLDSALSPFKAYKVKVSGVQDLRDRPMSPECGASCSNDDDNPRRRGLRTGLQGRWDTYGESHCPAI